MLISLCAASRGRPGAMTFTLQTFLEKSVGKMGTDLQVLIRLDSDDPTLPQYYELLGGIPHLGLAVGPRLAKGAAPHVNEMAMIAGGDLIMQVTDDQECVTEGWDQLLIDVARWRTKEPCVFQVNEGRAQLENPIVNRAWLEAVGYFYPAGPAHFYSDTFIETVARKSGRLVAVPSVTILHHKHKYQGDQTYLDARSRNSEDFDQWVALRETINALIAKLKKD